MMVEVLVSVVLLSVSILGLVRVLSQSVKDSGELQYRSEASTLADQFVGRMWVDPANLASYDTGGNFVALADLPGGEQKVEVDAANRIVTITIRWQVPGATTSSYETSATLARNAP